MVRILWFFLLLIELPTNSPHYWLNGSTLPPSYEEILTPVPHGVSILGNRVVGNVLSQDEVIRVCSNPM